MKKLLFIAFIAMAIGCSNNDNRTVAPTENLLVGKWKPYSVTYHGQTTIITGRCPNEGLLTLKADNTAEGVVALNSNCDMITDRYTYAVSGNVLTLTSGTDITKYNILESTSNTLKMEAFYDSDYGEYNTNDLETEVYVAVE